MLENEIGSKRVLDVITDHLSDRRLDSIMVHDEKYIKYSNIVSEHNEKMKLMHFSQQQMKMYDDLSCAEGELEAYDIRVIFRQGFVDYAKDWSNQERSNKHNPWYFKLVLSNSRKHQLLERDVLDCRGKLRKNTFTKKQKRFLHYYERYNDMLKAVIMELAYQQGMRDCDDLLHQLLKYKRHCRKKR